MSRITIRMSARSPISIDPEKWPLIAEAGECYPPGLPCQANHEWHLRIRERVDGMGLVYGEHVAGPGGVSAGWVPTYAGRFVRDGDFLISIVRDVAAAVGCPDLVQSLMQSLPAEEF